MSLEASIADPRYALRARGWVRVTPIPDWDGGSAKRLFADKDMDTPLPSNGIVKNLWYLSERYSVSGVYPTPFKLSLATMLKEVR